MLLYKKVLTAFGRIKRHRHGQRILIIVDEKFFVEK